jgi:hypothetical protein
MYHAGARRLIEVDTANHSPRTPTRSRMNAMVAMAPISPNLARIADLNTRRDRLVAALLGYRTAVWDDSSHHTDDLDVDAERARARERIRAVQNVKARRRRRKLGALGGRRMS